MNPLSNKKLERIAVNAIVLETDNPSSLLVPNIPVGDKGISFDGDIEVFKNHSETVGSLIGKVPVQVKGTQVNKFTDGTRTFPIEMDHFKNYYNSNGVVFFVVEIKADSTYKIFYKQLLPRELREIIKIYSEKKKQNKRIITLRPLNETTLDIVCKGFLEESKKQPTVLIENNPFTEKDYTEYEITSLTFNPYRVGTSDIFEHDFTIYGKKESLSIPLEIARVQSYSAIFEDTIVIDGFEQAFTVRVTKESNNTSIYLIIL